MASEFLLRAASTKDQRDVWEMLREFPASENGFRNPAAGLTLDRFHTLLERLEREAKGIGLKHGYVPQTTFWGFANSRPVGIIKIRHRLTNDLMRVGGHIGYGVRSSISVPYPRPRALGRTP